MHLSPLSALGLHSSWKQEALKFQWISVTASNPFQKALKSKEHPWETEEVRSI